MLAIFNSHLTAALFTFFSTALNTLAMESQNQEKFTLFYHAESPFSQFHPSKFVATPINFHGEQEENEAKAFLHCEQWMMYHKAKLFRDEDSARKILKAANPLTCKRLGRQVW